MPKEKKEKSRRPTKKQARLIAAVKDPKVETLAEAGKIAGYSDRQHAHRGLQTATVKTALEKYLLVLEKSGATDKRSAKVIAEGMVAEKTVSVEDYTDGAEEKAREKITEPDHNIRLKANDQYLKIKRIVSSDSVGKSEQHLHLHLGDKKTQDILNEIRGQLAYYDNSPKP